MKTRSMSVQRGLLGTVDPQVGEVQEGDHRKGGTDARPQAERVPAIRRLGLPLLLDS